MSASQNLIITEEKQGSELRVSLEGHLDRLTSPELRRLIGGYKGRLPAFVYRLDISENPGDPVKLEYQKALVV